MEHFLVVIRCLWNDLPMSLHHDLGEAFHKANCLARRVSDTPAVLDEQFAIVGIEYDLPLCASVYRLHDGRLAEVIGSFLIETDSPTLGPCSE